MVNHIAQAMDNNRLFIAILVGGTGSGDSIATVVGGNKAVHRFLRFGSTEKHCIVDNCGNQSQCYTYTSISKNGSNGTTSTAIKLSQTKKHSKRNGN